MIIIENFKRLYGLLKHCLHIKTKKKIDNFNKESLHLIKKGYYEFKVDIEEKNFHQIIINSINKYFPNSKGDRRLFSIEEESKEINEFFLYILNKHKENILKVSSIKNLYLHSVMAGHLINDKPNSSSGGDGDDEWHIDQHFELFKIIVYLSDVDEKNGPFSYLEGSHSKLIQLFILFFFKLFSKDPTRLSKKLTGIIKKLFFLNQKTFIGKKGTCIVFNSAGIHKGLIIENGERISITAYIFPFRKDNNIIYERNKHMNIPANLIKKNYENFLKL